MKKEESRRLHSGLIALYACDRRIEGAINLAEKDKGNLPSKLYGEITSTLGPLHSRIKDTIAEYEQRMKGNIKNVINRRM